MCYKDDKLWHGQEALYGKLDSQQYLASLYQEQILGKQAMIFHKQMRNIIWVHLLYTTISPT